MTMTLAIEDPFTMSNLSPIAIAAAGVLALGVSIYYCFGVCHMVFLLCMDRRLKNREIERMHERRRLGRLGLVGDHPLPHALQVAPGPQVYIRRRLGLIFQLIGARVEAHARGCLMPIGGAETDQHE
jgi:hypothetical protein